jgi:EAL domain-containing protein (putative c-di-GMP-specific phosphodiesterase class I)
MDPITRATPLSDAPAPVAPVWRAWSARAWTVSRQFLHLGRVPLPGRSLLGVHWRGVVLAATLAALVGGAGSSMLERTAQEAALADHARLVGGQVDRMLASIGEDLGAMAGQAQRLVGDPVPGPKGDACPADLTRLLARRSLDADLVRVFLLEQEGRVCGPLGGQSLPSLPWSDRPGAVRPGASGPMGSAAVTLTPMPSWGLMATRQLAPGMRIHAELDRERLQHAIRDQAMAGEMMLQTRLLSPEDAPLAVLSRAADAPSGGAPDARIAVEWRSAEHPLKVVVSLDAVSSWRAQSLAALGGALGGLLLMCFVAFWAWRRTVSQVRLRDRIARAVHKRQFEPFVQPLVDLASGRCVGGEVLMRWNHPVRGTLSPAEFIDEAERTGLIVPMTRLVIDRAAQRLAAVARADRRLQFAFNITPADLRQEGFAAILAATFHAETIPREQVVLELTERDFVDPLAQDALTALSAAGWQVAIDDFGTGHSSLAVLERMRVHKLKIDQAFVRTIDEQTVSRPVLDTIIALAHSLNLPLVAEGVETMTQRDYLAARGVQNAQGYLFARPMPIAEFERWLVAGVAGTETPLAGGAALDALDADVRALWGAMRADGGLDVRDRTWRARTWPQCFVGTDAVTWIGRTQGVGRRRAVQLGRRLAAFGLIQHVAGEHDFEDRNLFYRLVSPGDAGAAITAPLPPDLAASLRGPGGVPPGDHPSGVALHRRCVSGRAITAWMMARYAVPQAVALQWGAQLMRAGRLRHVFDDQPFRDDRSLYRYS